MSGPRRDRLRAGTLLSFHLWHLRRHWLQEMLACMGIALGVALILGVLVAGTTLTRPAGQLLRGLDGPAQLQLAARSETGFSQEIAVRAQGLPGVKAVASLLWEDATIVGPRGSRAVQLIGVTRALIPFLDDGRGEESGIGPLFNGYIGLSDTVGRSVGARGIQHLRMLVNGGVSSGDGFVLKGSGVGFLQNSNVAVGLLPLIQSLTAETGRVTQVLVTAQPGRERIPQTTLIRASSHGARSSSFQLSCCFVVVVGLCFAFVAVGFVVFGAADF